MPPEVRTSPGSRSHWQTRRPAKRPGRRRPPPRHSAAGRPGAGPSCRRGARRRVRPARRRAARGAQNRSPAGRSPARNRRPISATTPTISPPSSVPPGPVIDHGLHQGLVARTRPERFVDTLARGRRPTDARVHRHRVGVTAGIGLDTAPQPFRRRGQSIEIVMADHTVDRPRPRDAGRRDQRRAGPELGLAVQRETRVAGVERVMFGVVMIDPCRQPLAQAINELLGDAKKPSAPGLGPRRRYPAPPPGQAGAPALAASAAWRRPPVGASVGRGGDMASLQGRMGRHYRAAPPTDREFMAAA